MKVELALKVESPVHIGSGDLYVETDFVLENGFVKVIDFEKLFEIVKLDDEKVESLIQIAKEGRVKNRVLNVLRIKDLEMPFSRKIKFVGEEPKESLKIFKHIESSGKAFIPGSSLKGFIRTALLFKFLQENPEVLIRHFRDINEKIKIEDKRKIDRKAIAKKIESEVFGSTPTKDALKYLRVTDSTFASQTEVYRVIILGNPKVIPLYLECIPHGETLRCEIEIVDKLYETDGRIGKITPEDVFEAVKIFSKEIIKAEKNYRYPRETIEFYKKLEGKNVMRLGHSTGYFSKTIGLLLRDLGEFEGFRRKLGMGMNPVTKKFVSVFPKTRRVVEKGNLPLGWISYEVKK